MGRSSTFVSCDFWIILRRSGSGDRDGRGAGVRPYKYSSTTSYLAFPQVETQYLSQLDLKYSFWSTDDVAQDMMKVAKSVGWTLYPLGHWILQALYGRPKSSLSCRPTTNLGQWIAFHVMILDKRLEIMVLLRGQQKACCTGGDLGSLAKKLESRLQSWKRNALHLQ